MNSHSMEGGYPGYNIRVCELVNRLIQFAASLESYEIFINIIDSH